MNTANINSLWADLMVEELICLGVDYFVISPGSRSTPLTAAVASRRESGKLPGEVVIHYDERGAAFHALGYGRATGKPAALICTSGTAAANYYPAIIEASQDNVPLIALTADRPPELRHTGANQTIDQLHLYGEYVRSFVDLPCPDINSDPHMLLTTIDQAHANALGPPAGPVHLNCPYREPLAPLPDEAGPDLSAYTRQLESWQKSGNPLTGDTGSAVLVSNEDLTAVTDAIGKAKAGFILAGRLDNKAQREAVLALSDHLGWPLLTDITSGLRLQTSGQTIHHYDLLLASSSFANSVRPDLILQVGGRFVSKRLFQFIEGAAPDHYILINDSTAPLDPARRVTKKIENDIPSFCAALQQSGGDSSMHSYLDVWQWANDTARKVLETECENGVELAEAAVARHTSRSLPDSTGLFLASSMPVRDMDMFADAGTADVIVAANRGASGIDGTIASATGFASGLKRPVTLLIGDLAFLHDLNSLALLSRSQHPITVVVLNNNGGGIFDHLPIADRADIFEKYFVTPHGLEFKNAAGMFNLPYIRVEDMPSFAMAFNESQQSRRSSIIEVILDRSQSLSFHRSIVSKIVNAIDKLS